MNSGTVTLTVGSDWINSGTYFGTGTVVFDGTNTTHTVGGSSATTFGSLEINGSNTTFNYNSQVSMLSNLTVNSEVFQASSTLPLLVPGNVTIGDYGVLNATSISTLSVKGDWTKAEDGTFTPGSGKVVFNGTDQTLSGMTDFYGLEKSAAGTLKITDSCTIAESLTLTNGYIAISASSGLVLGPSATIAGGSTGSYVIGPFVHTVEVPTSGDEEKLFPFGSNGNYRPVTLTTSLSGTTNDIYYRGELHEGPPPDRTMPDDIDHVSQLRYYSINQSVPLSGTLLVNASVTMKYHTDDAVDTPSELRLAKSDGAGHWIDIGGTGSLGEITSDKFTSFSDFVMGSSTENNPLPVELLSLTAKPHGHTVKIYWSTASETDNSHFVVERSPDNRHFAPVATVAGVGTSQQIQRYQIVDDQPVVGNAYYRLKQVDFDDGYTYSRSVSVDFSGSTRTIVRLSPNPANEHTVVTVQGLEVGKRVQIQVLDPQGKIQQTSRTQQQGVFSAPFSADECSSLRTGRVYGSGNIRRFLLVRKVLD